MLRCWCLATPPLAAMHLIMPAGTWRRPGACIPLLPLPLSGGQLCMSVNQSSHARTCWRSVSAWRLHASASAACVCASWYSAATSPLRRASRSSVPDKDAPDPFSTCGSQGTAPSRKAPCLLLAASQAKASKVQKLLEPEVQCRMQETSLLDGLQYSTCPGSAGCDINIKQRRCSHETESSSTAEQGAGAASVQLACRAILFSSLVRVKWQPNFSPAAAPVAAPAKLARSLCGRAQLIGYKRTAHECQEGPSELWQSRCMQSLSDNLHEGSM